MAGTATDLDLRGRKLVIGRASVAVQDALVFTGVLVSVVGLAASSGGYFPASWGWSTLAFAWVTAAVLMLRTAIGLDRWSVAFLGLFLALAVWTLVSLAWTSSGAPVFEAERTLVYVTGVAAALVVGRRRTVPLFLSAVLAGIALVDIYSLGTRLFPARLGSFDPTAEYRLAAPIGYWNGLGILAVVGLAIATGMVARGRSPLTRGLAALALPILITTLYFTFSRGSWIALAVATVVMLAVDTRRLQLVTVAGVTLVPAAAVAWFATQQAALGTKGAALGAAVHQGRHLALAVALAGVAGAVIAVVACLLEERLAVPQRARRLYASILTMGALAAIVVGLLHVGGPAGAARRAWHSFTAAPASIAAGQSESKRLFSLSSNGRIALWKGALHESSAHPLLGGGAGSYESWWLQHRKVSERVKDAHSLYLQTLAELGPLGLALLALALALPLAVGIRARRRPLVPFALAAYAAFLLHAAVDWDWQLPGVTLPALLCGATVLVAGRTDEDGRLGSWVRIGAISAACAVAILAFFMLLGNVPLTKATTAADAARWSDSAREARNAARWLPWSAEPWRLIGEADLAARDRPAARVALRKAISRDPENWHLWFDLSAAEHGPAAARALTKASKLNPLSSDIAEFRP